MLKRVTSRPFWFLPGLIVVLVLLAVAIGAASLRYLERQLVAITGQNLVLVASDIADKLSWVLYERYGDIQVLAESPVLRGRDTAAITKKLATTQNAYPVYTWLGVMDAEGRIVAATDPASVGKDRSGSPWFQAVRDGGGIDVREELSDEDSGGVPAVVFTARLTSPSGKFVGVVTTRVEIPRLEDTFNPIIHALEVQRGSSADIEYQFMAQDGTLLADSQLREEGKVNLRQLGLPSAQLIGLADPGYLEEKDARRNMAVITGYAETHDVEDFRVPRWKILVRMDEAVVLAPIGAIKRNMTQAAAFIFVPLVGLLVWATNRLQTSYSKALEEGHRARTAEAGVREHSEVLGKLLEATRDITAHSHLELDRLLRKVAEVAQVLTKATYAALAVFDESGERLVKFIAVGIDDSTKAAIGNPPTGRGLLGIMGKHQGVLRLSDLSQHPASVGFPPHHPPMRSFLGVPIRVNGRLYGQLYLTDKRESGHEVLEFTELDEQTISTLASLFGEVIRNNQLFTTVRAAEARYRLLLESTGEGIYGVDLEERCTFINQAGAAMLGYRRDELLGKLLHALIHHRHADGSDLPLEECQILRTLETGVACSAEDEVFWRSDGTAFPVEYAACPIIEGERIRGAVVFFTDVTLRKQAEAELITHVWQQKAVVEVGQHALASRDLDLLCNEAVTRIKQILGVDFGEISELLPDGKGIRLRAGAGWEQDHMGHTTDPLPSNEPVIIEDLRADPRFSGSSCLHDHGVVSGVRVAICGQDQPLGVLGAYTTQRRMFTQDEVHFLQSVANVLAAAIVRQRAEETLRQSEAQFRQAQKMEAIGRLTGGIAHDFNNMLMIINGYSDMLTATLASGDPLRVHAEQIKQAGERAAALTRQLLAFSRRQVLQPIVLDLNAVVAGVEKMLRRLIGEDIRFMTNLNPESGRVKADPGQLEQVIMNLAVNARDAMPRGGTLTIETASVELAETDNRWRVAIPRGPYVMLTVSDTGCGMDATTQERIFEPFFTTKEKGKGTGLGLSTVYGIVKQSGGFILVDSAPGQGARFTIYLPRVEETAEISKDAALPVRSLRGSETILLVEDEEAVRKLVRKILESHGYTVLEAADGGDAFLVCGQYDGPIHLLVTDVVMPRMSGSELAHHLAQSRPSMKVLYMSGYAADAIGQHGVLSTDVAILSKPFTLDTLARKVREVLER